jgi:hypothetical protein
MRRLNPHAGVHPHCIVVPCVDFRGDFTAHRVESAEVAQSLYLVKPPERAFEKPRRPKRKDPVLSGQSPHVTECVVGCAQGIYVHLVVGPEPQEYLVQDSLGSAGREVVIDSKSHRSMR